MLSRSGTVYNMPLTTGFRWMQTIMSRMAREIWRQFRQIDTSMFSATSKQFLGTCSGRGQKAGICSCGPVKTGICLSGPAKAGVHSLMAVVPWDGQHAGTLFVPKLTPILSRHSAHNCLHPSKSCG